ncbi:MAG: FHA domain-containing protein [Deltaproteobacteria bacterium]|uniref:FHA domain-containing protein n=1 Tax=Candidatus Zymogenus saltonus TaxID=2844893 RepID=A0A9D8KGC1_9DELT|nr:FHA domain-containing protein [Candidatus Zymogenus saltonus]
MIKKERLLTFLIFLFSLPFLMGQGNPGAILNIILFIVIALIGLIMFALFVWAVIWSFKDCKARGGGALWVFSIFFFPIGWLIYLLARPKEMAGGYGVRAQMPDAGYQPGPAAITVRETVTAPHSVPSGGETMDMRGGGGGRANTPDRTVLISERDRAPVTGWLVVTSGDRKGERFDIRGDEADVGRGTDCDVIIDHETVSGHHAKIRNEGGKYILYDLASRNGTFLNDKKISKAQLRDGDNITLGEMKFVFKSL